MLPRIWPVPAGEHSFARKSVAVFLIILVYAVLLLGLFSRLGTPGVAISLLVVLGTTWFLGLVPGLVIALLLFPVHALVFYLAGVPDWSATVLRGLVGHFVLVGVAAVAGGMQTLVQQVRSQSTELIRERAALQAEIEARRQAETAIAQRLQAQMTIQQAIAVIGSSLSLTTVLNSVARQMAEAIDCTSAYICDFDVENARCTVVAEYLGPQASEAELESDLGVTYEERNQRFITRITHGLHDVSHLDDPHISPEEREHLRKYGGRSVLYVSLLVGGRPVAFVELWESRRRREFTSEEITLCQSIAQYAAFALENARLYEALYQAKEASEQATAAKNDFISLVVHELNLPLTLIRGYGELIPLLGRLNDEQEAALHKILDASGRMGRLVSDLTDIARMERGELTLDLEMVQVPHVIHEVHQTLQPQFATKEQALHIELPPDLPAVWADPFRLAQILTNLLSNAHKYTPEQGQIVVRAAHLAPGNGPRPAAESVQITIQDNGIGMAVADQQEIFTPFFRAADQQTRNVPGTGLGLTIARHLIELHGGDIWFESETGKGSSFHVRLPLADGYR